MARPSRTRRILKWTGTIISLLIISIWLLSLWCDVRYRATGYTFFRIVPGHVGVVVFSFALPPVPGMTASAVNWHAFDRFGFDAPWGQSQDQLSRRNPNHWVYSIVVSLWFLLVLSALPTAWLWHRDRGWKRPGCCLRCGYDLTGNTSGICSECGLSATPTPEESGR